MNGRGMRRESATPLPGVGFQDPPKNPADEPQNNPQNQYPNDKGSDYQNNGFRFTFTFLTFTGDMENLANVLQNSNLGLSIGIPNIFGGIQDRMAACLQAFNLCVRANI